MGASVAKWLRWCDFKSLVPHHHGFKSIQGFWTLSYEEASIQIILFYGSTYVPVVPEIMHGGAPEVFLRQ